MERKKLIMWCLMIGSGVGGYIPALWGSSVFSVSSVVFSAIGGVLGIWAGYTLGE